MIIPPLVFLGMVDLFDLVQILVILCFTFVLKDFLSELEIKFFSDEYLQMYKHFFYLQAYLHQTQTYSQASKLLKAYTYRHKSY